MTAEVISILRRLSEIRKDLVRTEQELLALDHLLEVPHALNPVFQLETSKSEKNSVVSTRGSGEVLEVFYLTLENINTIDNFADHVGYISHDHHQDFHDLLKELREYRNHVRDL